MAYTDAVQAVVLIIIMFIFPGVFSHTFGGWVNVSCTGVDLCFVADDIL